MEQYIYNRYAVYLKEHYGQKIYKLPVHIPVSCPNRKNGRYGCTYCGQKGAGLEQKSDAFSVEGQLKGNMAYISKRYKAEKFIAYFQSFTNTYLPLEEFQKYMEQAVQQNIVEIAVSTRPDCVRLEYLEVLKELSEKNGIEITVELGLQTANYHSLEKINRGHTLAEYIEACMLIKQYGFHLCTHVILNLPYDEKIDVIESAKLVSVMKNDYVKLHSLYIEKDTKMAEEYTKGLFKICSVEEYKERVKLFLEYIAPNIWVQRLLGRVPEEDSLFANWGQSWWKIRDEIEQEMITENRYQSKKFDYLGGKGVKEFF